MLPDWMEHTDQYRPPKGGNNFAVRTMQSLGGALARIQVQKGHEKGHPLPPVVKLLLMVAGILLVSLASDRLVIMAYAAVLLVYLCTWPARDIPGILSPSFLASGLAFVVLLPAVVLKPALVSNELWIVIKVFFSVLTVSIFNHTTQWNHITKALRQLHIPGIFIFTIDITLKYIVLLGNLICRLLTALQLRSVGRNPKKYRSVGGVMGVTFIRGTELNRQMYEAMQCRGFTDDYKGL